MNAHKPCQIVFPLSPLFSCQSKMMMVLIYVRKPRRHCILLPGMAILFPSLLFLLRYCSSCCDRFQDLNVVFVSTEIKCFRHWVCNVCSDLWTGLRLDQCGGKCLTTVQDVYSDGFLLHFGHQISLDSQHTWGLLCLWGHRPHGGPEASFGPGSHVGTLWCPPSLRNPI